MNRTRVLFLAWGDSIHARRRIQIFVEDPRFDVMVVSTFNYRFKNARNVLLVSGGGKRWDPNREGAGEPPEEEYRDSEPIPEPKRTVRDWTNKLILGVFSSPALAALQRKMFNVAKKGLGLQLMWKDLKLLKTVAKNFCPDILFLQTLLYPSYLAYFLKRSIPMIITFWNGDVTWWAKWNGVERLLKKQIVMYGVKRAKLITVNSQKAFASCLGYGTTEEKIKVVRYPGVDLELFKPIPREEAKNRIGISDPKMVFCPRGVGGFLNSQTILEAVPAVIQSYPGARFVFAGTAFEEDLIRHRRRMEELGIQAHCLWKGLIPWKEMPLYYSSSDVMVSISSKDSLPNCMLEAMACGVPVIMGDIPQIREWVQNETNGFLVSPQDAGALATAILKVFERQNLVEQFVRRNEKRISLEADSRKNCEVIKDLVLQILQEGNNKGLRGSGSAGYEG